MKYNSYKKGFEIYLKLERALATNSIEAYIHDTDLLFNFLINSENEKSLQSINLKDLREFVTYINKLEFGAYSQARIISGVKAFFRYLMEENIIQTDPTELLEAPKLGRKLPDILSVDDVTAIINSVDLSSINGERNKAIFETLYGCGLRVSELVGLKISDLHFNEEIISVTGKGNKQRLIPIVQSARKQVERYIKEVRIHTKVQKKAEDIVFLNNRGGKMSRQMIFIIVKKQAELAGIRKTISPHTFRHSFATHLVQNGADLRAIQDLLGHSSIITTEIYTHLDSKDLRKAILKYHPRSL
jgi:integrase/recombinase XerD